MLTAADGTPWVFQLAGTHPQTYTVIVTDLQEADLGGFSGYLTLRSFFRNITNGAMTAWSFTHDDGETATVACSPALAFP